MTQSTNEILEDFESFWESEAPRIGESDAMGWSKHQTTSDSLPPPPPISSDAILSINSSSISRWHDAESKRLGPARTSDPDSDDDPFRCVLSDDIRNLLFRVSNFESQQALIYSFLSFMGICLPPPDVDTNVPFFTDPFLTSEIADRQEKFWPTIEPNPIIDINGMRESLPGIRNPLNSPFRVFPSDQRQLFSDPLKWFASFNPKASEVPFIQNALRLLQTSNILKNDMYFNLCVISVEARLDVTSAIKLIKHILSEDPTRLLLWDAYARLCLLKGKAKTAREVYIKTLTMVEDEQQDLTFLWYSWAEMEFELGNTGLCSRILARAMQCSDTPPTRE